MAANPLATPVKPRSAKTNAAISDAIIQPIITVNFYLIKAVFSTIIPLEKK
jgi:hypothetical protein